MQAHFRKTFLAGAFALIPVVVTVAIAVYVEHQTRGPFAGTPLAKIPGIGLLIALAAVYFTGLFVSSFIGRALIGWFDRLLHRLPLLSDLYRAWKQVSLSPGGGEGIYGRVVLVPDGPPGAPLILAFSTGEPIAPGSDRVAVFAPGSPNPVTGRVLIVHARDVIVTTMSAEEAFKLLLSSGNYVPCEIATALAPPTAA